MKYPPPVPADMSKAKTTIPNQVLRKSMNIQNKHFILIVLPFSTLLMTSTSQARLNTFTSGITTGYDYTKTDRDQSETNGAITTETQDFQKFSIGPIFILASSSSLDNLSIRYTPSFTYDIEKSNNDIDHNFSLSSYRDFTEKLRLNLSDNFLYSDDPDLIETDISSDYNSGRRRYLTNTFNLDSRYTYDINSSIGGGYTYKILRNEDTGPGGYEDYDKHIADFSLQHYIDASWNMGVTASYTRGLFDPPDQRIVDRIEADLESIAEGITDTIDTTELSNDLSEYRAAVSLGYILTPRKTLRASYDFSGTVYDAILRNDTNLHNLTFSGQYKHSPRLTFDLGGGPSYEKTETFDANWGYNAHLDLNYDVTIHSAFSASVAKGYSQENFSANNNQLGRDQGLTEFWNWKLDYSHQLQKDINLTLFASYRDERQENILHGFVTSTEDGTDLQSIDRETFREKSLFDKDIYNTGGNLSYSFMQYWTTAINYSFRRQESERVNDSYDEHRIHLTLSVQNEIFRW